MSTNKMIEHSTILMASQKTLIQHTASQGDTFDTTSKKLHDHTHENHRQPHAFDPGILNSQRAYGGCLVLFFFVIFMGGYGVFCGHFGCVFVFFLFRFVCGGVLFVRLSVFYWLSLVYSFIVVEGRSSFTDGFGTS